ncbi:MAG TPA: hypothetical protein VIR27_14530 [Mycobacteriales bacterium]|jgi:hypothetical protein
MSDLFTRVLALGGTGLGIARNILSGLDLPQAGGARSDVAAAHGGSPAGTDPTQRGKSTG